MSCLIQPLNLPKRLPNPEVIASHRNNVHDYEPAFWEFQYQVYRYLERVETANLIARHESILRNIEWLVTADDGAIPIQVFQSPWYWCRKEHQTRFEFFLRGVERPHTSSLPECGRERDSAHPKPARPYTFKTLFRYGQRAHLKPMLERGAVRIAPAGRFADLSNDGARMDEELRKRSYLPGAHTRIRTQDGHDIPIIGDVEQSISTDNYYVFCTAGDWGSSFFSAFEGSDACLVIREPEEFARRMETASQAILPGWYFHHNPVQYFDPYERVKNEYFSAGMSKDFKFAYQQEYRFLWDPLGRKEADDFKYLELGSLEDIAEIHLDPRGDQTGDTKA